MSELPRDLPRDRQPLPANGREARGGEPHRRPAGLYEHLHDERRLHAPRIGSARKRLRRVCRYLRTLRGKLRGGRPGRRPDAPLRRRMPAMRRVVPDDVTSEGQCLTPPLAWSAIGPRILNPMRLATWAVIVVLSGMHTAAVVCDASCAWPQFGTVRTEAAPCASHAGPAAQTRFSAPAHECGRQPAVAPVARAEKPLRTGVVLAASDAPAGVGLPLFAAPSPDGAGDLTLPGRARLPLRI